MCARLRNPVLGAVVDEDDPEPLLITPAPLKVVEQGPDVVSGQVDAVFDGSSRGGQVLVQIPDPFGVVNKALRVHVVLGRTAVFGDVQRHSSRFLGQPDQQLVQAVGVDQPAHRGSLQPVGAVFDDTGNPEPRLALADAQVLRVAGAQIGAGVVVNAEEVDGLG